MSAERKSTRAKKPSTTKQYPDGKLEIFSFFRVQLAIYLDYFNFCF